ncbi:MAG TPA: phosphotransferase, partial [Clostridia bacterium]|nr:phosphotransferase [Clostridia bacterium]
AVRQYSGQAIRLLDDDTAYMVMDFRSGKTENPGTVTATQMRSLGGACGAMHQAFSKLPVLSVEGYPLDDGQVLDSLWADHRARLREFSPSDPAEYRNAVLAEEPILKRLTPGFFETFPKGIAHEDFAADNILFDADGVSAIVDFDRNHFSYVWHDIGRAMLSFALKDGAMDIGKICAFLEGYSRHAALTMPNIADALRLSWCIEAPWWIRPERFGDNSAKVLRFRDELLWLTEHWFEIDSILGV